MFNTPTVFILGAGASWHYGYPTGEGLVRKVIAKAAYVASYLEFRAQRADGHLPDFLARRVEQGHEEPWFKLAAEAHRLIGRLKEVNPTLIDYFLAQNADLHEIGKLVIAMVIFDCESAFAAERGNPNRRELLRIQKSRGVLPAGSTVDVTAFDDDWLRFVLYKLTSRCRASADLLDNDVTFVTFNYDTSLERRLFMGLKNISLFGEDDVRSFLGNGRVLHVYGKVRDDMGLGWQSVPVILPHSDRDESFRETRKLFDYCHAASLGIRTIDGPEKVKDEAVLAAASNAIEAAQKLFILGYGFDESNSERIGLTSLRHEGDPRRCVFFTNFGGHNRVSMAASRALSDSNDLFLPEGGQSIRAHHLQLQMSTKNVYDALNEDFESLETD